MAFNRMWNYVNGWTPFRPQTSTRIAMDKDPGVTLLRQEYHSAIDSFKPDEGKTVERLLRLSYENLKLQFTAKQQYKGDAVQNLIDKHLELLTKKEATISHTAKPETDTKSSVVKESSQTKPVSPAKSAAQVESADSEIAAKQVVSSTGRAKAVDEEKAVKSKDVSGSTGLSSSELTSALDAFEASLGPGAGAAQPLEVKEEALTPGKAIFTGGRGNPYYEEELRRAVDESMEGDIKDVKPAVCPAKPKDPADNSVKPLVGPSKAASDIKPSTESTKPVTVIKAVDPVPKKPATATEVSTGKSQETPSKPGTGLPKEEISKNLDIFSASLEDEIPGADIEDIEVISKSQATGRAKPPAEVEEKVVKVNKTTGATNLSKDEITSALDAFESSLGGDLGGEEDLFGGNLATDITDVKDATVNEEETLKPGKAIITGGRGNPYYEEELRKAVDESMGTDKETNPSANPAKDSANISAKSVVDPSKPVVSPQKDSKNDDAKPTTDSTKPATISDKNSTICTDKVDAGKEKSDKPKSASIENKDKQPVAAPASTGSPEKVDEKPINADKSDIKPVHTVSGETQHRATEGQQHSSDAPKDTKSGKEVKPSGEPTEKKLKPENAANQQPTKTDGNTDKESAAQTKPSSDSKTHEHLKATVEKK